MTRKDYEAIADILRKRASDYQFSWDGTDAVKDIGNDLADLFAADNARFDRARFMKAL